MIVHAPGCHVPLDWDVLAAFSVIYSERCFACEHLFKHSSPLPLAVINSVWWVPVFPSAWGLMAWFPWFTSYGSGPHLEAGCQYWKLLDASGTQLPFSEAVVNLLSIFFRRIKNERREYTVEEDFALDKFVKENVNCWSMKGSNLYKMAEEAKVWQLNVVNVGLLVQ